MGSNIDTSNRPTLQSPADYSRWHAWIMMIAGLYKVRKYVDPDTTDNNEKPVIEYPDVADINFSNKMSLAKTQHHDAIQEWKDNEVGIRAVTEEITKSVSSLYHQKILKHSDARAMLKEIKDDVKPDNFAQQRHVYQRYQTHLRSIKRSQLNQWLLTYEEIMGDAMSVKVPMLMDPLAQVSDFLHAVKGISPEYFNGASVSFSEASQKTEPNATATDGKSAGVKEVNKFQQWVHWLTASKPPSAASKGTSHAVWQGGDENATSTPPPASNDKNRGQRDNNGTPKCPIVSI
ncbi:hypothetical protein COL922a_011039 [Colletotrichum nupharicola]|nr:hypothetical protein COL922a_011039 [Colletotrichum nupharicola]